MTLAPLGLLGLVGAGARAIRPAPSAGEVEKTDFAELLAKAERGELSSGREIAIGKGVQVKLDATQREQIAAAADRAEAQGVQNLLVLIDGMALRLDVTARTVTEQVDLAASGVTTGVDAVVRLPGNGSRKNAEIAEPPAPLVPPPRAGASNPSLLEVLARSEK